MTAAQIFGSDIKQALRAWRTDPRFPLLTLALVVLHSFPEFFGVDSEARGPQGILNLLVLFPLLFSIGYVGTERIWYLRIFRGSRLSVREIPNLTWRFLGRYFALGWFAMVIFIPGLVVLFAQGGSLADISTPRGAFLVPYIICTVVYDLLITFATPALAYSTSRVTEALGINIRIVKEHWPVSALYVFVPTFAVLVLVRLWPTPTAVPLFAAAMVASTLLNLLFKGATAAFYLRLHPDVPNDGAAHLSPTVSEDHEQVTQS